MRINKARQWALAGCYAIFSKTNATYSSSVDRKLSAHNLSEVFMSQTAPWITYRPELKVLDCTIRDGGLINNHQFTEELVRAVYDTCVAAGVDYMEVGYKASPKQHPREKFGEWRFCDEDV